MQKMRSNKPYKCPNKNMHKSLHFLVLPVLSESIENMSVKVYT